MFVASCIDATSSTGTADISECAKPLDTDNTFQLGLFSLEQRAHTVACALFARDYSLQSHTIMLPDNSCAVLGSSSGKWHLKNVTIQGSLQPASSLPHILSLFLLLSVQGPRMFLVA